MNSRRSDYVDIGIAGVACFGSRATAAAAAAASATATTSAAASATTRLFASPPLCVWLLGAVFAICAALIVCLRAARRSC